MSWSNGEEASEAIFSADPLRVLLVKRAKINSRLRAISFGLVWRGIYFILVPALTGNLQIALRDRVSIAISLTVMPAVALFYCYEQRDMIESVLNGIRGSGTIKPSKKPLREHFDEYTSLASARKVSAGVLAATVVASVLTARDILTTPVTEISIWVYDPKSPLTFFLVFLPMNAVLLYMSFAFLVQHLIAIRAVRRIFLDSRVELFALHPDKCGGLSFLGKFSIRTSYFFAVVGLNFGLMIAGHVIYGDTDFSVPLGIALGVLAYFILVPAIFFLTLYPAHDGMKTAKRESQEAIARQADALHGEIESGLAMNATVYPDVERLESLHRLYGLSQQFPVWPFDFQTLRRLVAVILTPLLPAIVIELINLLPRWMPRFGP